MASCIVNNSPNNVTADNHSSGDGYNDNNEATGSVTLPSSLGGLLQRYRMHSSSREFKSGLSNVFTVLPLKPPLNDLLNRFQGASTQNNNLIQTSNDHVDVSPSADIVSGSLSNAIGYPFPPSRNKVHQHFKQFSINLGRFGFQGAGAFHYQNIYPYGIRWELCGKNGNLMMDEISKIIS